MTLSIQKGKPQPAPLDTVTLSPEQVFEALRLYVRQQAGRRVHEIVGNQAVHSLSRECPSFSFTLTLKPESEA